MSAAPQIDMFCDISPEKANELWRKVLARLVMDYFEDYRCADLHVMGESLEILCEILDFDFERTKQELIMAKQEYESSGENLADWLKTRWNSVHRY